ncbi:MAG: phosphate ABC transporter substrate-binding protein [Eubacteriaceae bacterium]|nr:phosphate ABC transporter substrate-binding protein [Eubacteriaceae bacterium]
MHNLKRFSSIFMVLLMSAVLFAGCSSGGASTDDAAKVTGEIIAGGSTSTKNIMEASGEEFSALNPDVAFEYNATGSSDGVKGANEGTYMLGTASREIKEDEKAWKLTEKVFAYDGIAVVVHPSNEAFSDITTEQIAQIFKGEITNWSELGGADAPIVVVSREDGSGTRGAFEELLGFEDALTQEATIAEGNGNVQSTVAGNENAIGYVSFTYIDETVKALKVEGVAPTTEDVLNETYPISRPFVMIYHEDNLSDAAKAYIDFLMSADGQKIVEDEGGIPLAK